MNPSVYTYFSTETEHASAKLSARNINAVATGDFTVKLSAPLQCGYGNFDSHSANGPTTIRMPYIYTGVYSHELEVTAQRLNKRLFKLLEGKVNVLGVTVGIPQGSCQYLKFRKIGNQGHIATLSDQP